jgi:glyoxylase-like metal-dependent hydrolase (beta-lactamase superfamily II)
MDSLVEGLYATVPQRLPFDRTADVRAFLLRRERGNLLIYSVEGIESEAAEIEGLGAVSRHYLNHWHESMFASDSVDAPLHVHENERAEVRGYDVGDTFSKRHTVDDDFEVIPTPGHTGGATAYLWDSGAHRMLFTGDTIYLSQGEWVAAVLESSDRESYIQSLELIRELDFDVLVPWVATAGQPYHAVTDPDDARRRIDAILERVRSGQDH